MFAIAARAEFWRTVTVLMPCDDGFREETFRARFQAIPSSEKAELLELDDMGQALLRRIVTDIADVTGADGKPLPFTTAFDAIMDETPARLALIATYTRALGQVKAGN